MPTVTYPKNANSDTVFVEDGGKKTRAIKTVEPDGTVTYPSNANSENCYVTVDGKKQRALMTAPQDTSTLEYPNNPNSTKGYVTVNGKKQRVIITANIAGGGSAPVIDELNVTPSTSAQTITATGGVDGYSPVNVSAVDASIDANIVAGNIKSGATILGVTGNVVELNGETVSVTPTTSSQTITPTSPKNAITEVSVSAVTSSIDANIQAGNIKKDVTILGVTGSYEGGGGGIGHALPKDVDANGVLQNGSSVIDLTGVNDIGYSVLWYAYYQSTFPANTPVDFSDLTQISNEYACYWAFYGSSGISSVDLSSLQTISGNYACQSMFYHCTTITSIDLSALTIVNGANSCEEWFRGCTGITTANLSSLTIVGAQCFKSAFRECTGLTSVNLSSLSELGNSALQYAFRGCTNLTSLSFPALTAIVSSSFNNMCQDIPNITLHFPAAMQTAVESATGYSATAPFGALAGSVLFDL